MNRRNFVKNSALLSGAMTLVPYFSNAKPVFNYKSIIDYLNNFHNAIGSSNLSHSSNIRKLIKRNEDIQDCTLEKNIEKEHKKMKKKDFELLDSKKRCNTYMLTYGEDWYYEQVRLLVFDKCKGNLRTVLDHPSIIGISESAKDIYYQTKSVNEAFNNITPLIGVRDSIRSYSGSYSKSLEYKSREAEVEIDFKKNRYNNKGLIKVIASKGFNRLLDKEIIINA